MRFGRPLSVLVLLAGLGYWASVSLLSEQVRRRGADDLAVYLPPVAQLVAAAGDRYLAANVDVFRTFMIGPGPFSPEVYEILARLHADAALLNPGHEDNYYVAAAILPWAGRVSEAQYVLRRAMALRPRDFLPPFLYAFNQRQFQNDPLGAVDTLRTAAPKLQDEQSRLAFEVLAARWYEKAEGANAAEVLRIMASQTRNPAFAAYLERRAGRLEAISRLEAALAEWRRTRGGSPPDLDALVRHQYLPELPRDPFGGSFRLSPEGNISVIERKQGA
ncbi:hypothetical protein dqs_3491 [Azoarcus olearius]|uniref:hypothetical protein n=1 Tax=Azoarcus sp. (strain BH72) TaxID=418699 RepID=UPI0008062C14|nr:hypothetical protein [Azoarcus olearius]ANQ86512.1 hypothetical protein dqs_3491 [Azoarcus olearius]